MIVGDGGVGKFSLIQKYCKGFFTAEYKKTIGVDFLEKRIWWDLSFVYFVSFNSHIPKCMTSKLTFSVNGEDVRLMLWDTAGQEEFDCITRAYYRLMLKCT